jgi:hypothetical protein
MSLRIELRIPDAFHARATHALETLALAWGTPVTIGASPLAESTVVYGEDAAGSDSRLVLPFDHRAYDPATPFAKRRVEGVPVWAPADDDGRPADLVGATHRLLAFLDEQQIPEARRDRRGIFLSADLPAGRGEATADPLVEDMAGLLWRLLLQAHPGLERDVEPRWPEGKRWALALSHDTDAVRLGAWAEVGTNLAKSLLRRDATAWRMARLGLAFRSTPGADPAFGFPRWRAWEGERGLRSAFYLFVMPPKAWRDPNECKSTVLDPAVDWGLFREMADDGWEFGLHAPIASTPDLDVLLWCKHAIETRLHRPIHGLRHHYWALDWRRPHLTYRRHVNAGFRYDTSIAWRDRAGFRAGTALPFRPFDPGRERSLQIEVLPTALMDGHVIRNPQVEHPEPAVSRLFERIRGVGGLALLDWHTETAWNRLRHAGYLDHLAAFLDPVLEDASCWKATPW